MATNVWISEKSSSKMTNIFWQLKSFFSFVKLGKRRISTLYRLRLDHPLPSLREKKILIVKFFNKFLKGLVTWLLIYPLLWLTHLLLCLFWQPNYKLSYDIFFRYIKKCEHIWIGLGIFKKGIWFNMYQTPLYQRIIY